LLSDTVGFIRDLPHHLVASFRATLAEARHARLLLHVVDASNPQAEQQIDAVTAVLKELGCTNQPTLLVLNKIDRLEDRSRLRLLEGRHHRCVAVSALTGEGLDQLADMVVEMLAEDFAEAEIITSAGNGKVLAYLNAHAEVYRQEFHDEANEVRLHCHLPRRLLQQLRDPSVRIRLL
jgi:GTP-binding protein HflX